MSSEDLILKLQESCQQLMKIVDEKDKQIELLQSGQNKGFTEQNTLSEYMEIFKKFVIQAKDHNWIIEGKYKTKNSRDFISVDFAKYIEFINATLPEQKHVDFKKFMESLQLIDAQSTNFMGSGKDRVRTVKVRAEAYNILVN